MAEHVDLVGHTLEVGDRVAYPTQSGSSSRMCVAEILEIIDYTVRALRYVKFDELDEQGRHGKHESYEKETWKVRLQPLKYTDYRSDYDYRDGERTRHAPKAVMVQRVENLVRVGPLKVEVRDLTASVENLGYVG